MGLGSLRLLLSMMVIDAHYGAFRNFIQPLLVTTFGIDRLAYVGEGGVAIAGFFVISGYVIAYVLFHKYDPGSWRGVGVFLIGRALRIYPLYLLVFALYWLAAAGIGNAPHFSAAQLADNVLLLPTGVLALLGDHTRLGAMQMTGQFFIGPAWTLSFDLLLYVMAPFLLVHKRALWLTWLFGLVYFAAFAVTLDPRPPFWFASLYTSPIVYTFAFASGALVFHYGDRFVPRPPAIIAAAMLVLWLTYLPLGFTNTALNQLLAILALTVLVAGLKEFGKGRRHDRFFGDLTYATYLVHLPMLLLLERVGANYGALIALALTYALGAALLVLFEYPMDRLRDRVHARLHGAGGPAPVAFKAVTASLLIVLLAAAVASFVRNGAGAGSVAAMRADACPDLWTCVAGTGSAQVQVRGAGLASLAPALRTDSRAIVDIGNEGRAGTVFTGLRDSAGGLIAGVRRVGSKCVLVVEYAGRSEPSPRGWNDDCARAHRFVLDASAGNLVIAVDSLWVYATAQNAVDVTLTVIASEESAGTARFTGVLAR